MASKRIPGLPNQPVVNGLMLLAGYDPATDTTVNMRVQDVVPDAPDNSLLWNEATVYNQNDVALLDNILWVAQQNGFSGVMPGTDPLFWVAEGESPSSVLNPWQAGVYLKNNASVLYTIDGLTQAFKMVAAAPFNSTNFLVEYAAGSWELIGKDWPEAVADSSVSPIVLEVGNSDKKRFTLSAPIAVAKSFQILGATFPKELELYFEVDPAAVLPLQLTFPSSVKMADARWDSVNHVWETYDVGMFKLKATRVGGVWFADISQSAYV